MNLQMGMWIATIALEIILLVLLLLRHAWKSVPFFCSLIAWNVLFDISGYVIAHRAPVGYIHYYTIGITFDSLLQFCVLVELAVLALRPSSSRITLRAVMILSLLIFAAGCLIWPFTHIPGLNSQYTSVVLSAHLQQTVSVLRILIFVMLASCSQWLAISWRNRELQVATGLGVLSLVSLAVSIAQTRQTDWSGYSLLGEIVAAAYNLSLLYWIVCFTRQEAERKELSPKTLQAIKLVAGHARLGREAAFDSLQKPPQ